MSLILTFSLGDPFENNSLLVCRVCQYDMRSLLTNECSLPSDKHKHTADCVCAL